MISPIDGHPVTTWISSEVARWFPKHLNDDYDGCDGNSKRAGVKDNVFFIRKRNWINKKETRVGIWQRCASAGVPQCLHLFRTARILHIAAGFLGLLLLLSRLLHFILHFILHFLTLLGTASLFFFIIILPSSSLLLFKELDEAEECPRPHSSSSNHLNFHSFNRLLIISHRQFSSSNWDITDALSNRWPSRDYRRHVTG